MFCMYTKSLLVSFFLNVFEVSYVPQGCIYLIKTTKKGHIDKYYDNLNWQITKRKKNYFHTDHATHFYCLPA